MHGSADDVVPIEHARDLAAAGGDTVEVRIVVNGPHGCATTRVRSRAFWVGSTARSLRSGPSLLRAALRFNTSSSISSRS
jgi:hypothetical protein